jgi:hypothetical protein
MKVIDKAEYVTKVFTIETDDEIYIVRMAENDWDEEISIITESGDEIDIESELYKQLIETCEQYDEDLGPEHDSAGFTEDDRIVNGQYRVISNKAADEDYKVSLMQDEQRYENKH